MAHCIIHIGMHKTGSTSIQQSLHGFSDGSFHYAKLGDAANHSLAMYSLFAPSPERHHLHMAAGRTEGAVRSYVAGVRADLERAIAAAGDRTLLISGEDVSVIPQAGLVRLRDYFRQRFDDLTIVGYVRPPASFMASAFQQRIRRAPSNLSLEGAYRNYEKSFGKFDEIFGREKVQLWKFDARTFPQGCAVRDFCARLNISFPPERIVRLNESFSREAVSALYTYHAVNRTKRSTMKGWESQRIGALLGGAGGTKFRFAPEAVRPVLERNRTDIEWMARRLEQSLDEELSSQPGDVRNEADLLTPDPKAVSRLIDLLNDADALPPNVSGATPQEVAMLVHALRQTLEPPGAPGGKPLNAQLSALGVKPIRQARTQLTELIEDIRHLDPGLLDAIPQSKAETLVKTVFEYINSSLAEEGSVNYAGLGRFQVRKVDSSVRIGFQPSRSLVAQSEVPED